MYKCGILVPYYNNSFSGELFENNFSHDNELYAAHSQC